MLFICFVTLLYTIPIATALPSGCLHLSNPTPSQGATDVNVTAKGVQTCINISVPQGCVANVTLQWFNYSDFIWDWIWCYFFGIGCPVSRFEEQYWNNYSNGTFTQNSQLCGWNENVSCSIYGYLFEYDWRVVANFTCGQDSYEETCYYWYSAEECTLFYIYPNMSQNGVCPDCVSLCAGVQNMFGHPMNVTFESNLSGTLDYFYLGIDNVTFSNVENNTYCIFVPFFSQYNHTYYWRVNVTDTITGLYNQSDVFVFHTAENLSDCPCGEDALIELIEEIDTIRDDTWIVGLIPVFMCIPFVFAIKQRKKKKQKIDNTYPMHFEGENFE